MANKKAQMTLFIIIGIIIVLAAAIVTVYINLSKTIEEEEITEKFEEAPVWAMPIKEYIDNCIEVKAIKAFKEIGRHGGYIDMNDYYLSEKTFNLNNNPVESDAVFLSENSNPVPYWWYLETETTCSECEMSSQMPSLAEIEQQVNRYIERELPSCIDDFKSFRNQGFDFDIESIKANASVNLEDVSVLVNYPVTIKKADSKTSIENFELNIDLSFFDIYVLAAAITYDEYYNQTFDDLLSNWLHYYSQPPEKEKIPPPVWIDNKRSTVTWKEDDVKETMKEAIIPYYVSLTQVNGTRNATHITVNDPAVQGIYDMHFLNIINYSYPELSIAFMYSPSWNIYLNIDFKNGGILEPRTVITEYPFDALPSEQTNYYEFFYDIAHPIVVIIRDIRSLKKHGEEGYSFMFALEANIKDNKNLWEWNQGRGTIGAYEYDFNASPPSITYENCTQEGDQWKCPISGKDEKRYDKEYTCNADCYSSKPVSWNSTKKQICDSVQKISNITLTVTDSNNAPVEGASVRFRCGNYATCSLGSTDSNGKFSGKSPMCIGDAFLIIEKDGVLSKTMNIGSIEPGKSYTFSTSVDTLTELNATAVYINITNLFHTKQDLMTRYFDNVYKILEDIIKASNNSIPPAESSLLSASELSSVQAAKQNILNSKAELKKYNYFHEMVDSEVINAALKTRDAINLAKTLIDSKGWLSGISYEPYYSELNQLTKNIQFLQGPELSDSALIQKYRNEALSLNENEEVTITVNKIKTDTNEGNIPIPTISISQSEKGAISLASGKYGIYAMLYDTEGYIIPAKGVFPKQDYIPAYQGGLEINESYAWTIGDINNKKEITFYVLKLENFQSTEELQELGNIAKYSERFRNFLEPEIK